MDPPSFVNKHIC